MRVEQSTPRCINELCSLLGYSRQAYYQQKRKEEKEVFGEELILQEVLRHRKIMKRLGGRKLMVLMNNFMQQHAIGMGRDTFFDLLRDNGLLIRRRRHRPHTTNSRHWLRKYPNLIEYFIPTSPNQLWVSDITYIRLPNEFAYLSLITDAYSRKIVGFYLCENLSAKGCINALKMALKSLPEKHCLIHHSDRGVQYCSTDYVALLVKRHICISMTQTGNPKENPLAERVNGILKEELLEEVFLSLSIAREKVAIAISIYNFQRPHLSINMLTPVEAHNSEGPLTRRWKNYYPYKKETEVAMT
jgi:transposase InsO family protein